jgi:hypothetical protein
MANPEHLQILKQGVEAWNQWRHNQWRHTNRNIKPDLAGAPLAWANLSHGHFAQADFSGANLTHADLSYTVIVEANFSEADLTGAVLVQAYGSGANFSGAKLTNAHLNLADLAGVNLTRAVLAAADLRVAVLLGADLTGADVSQMLLSETFFSNTNLTAVRGLETCRHEGPSTLDHRTLARSGPLPLAFLRGCGLPDTLIDYLPSLLNEPFQFYSCFISYSSTDELFCRRLHGRLQDAGLRVWFAPHDMQGGQKLHEQIDQAIRVYDKLLLVLSPHSMQSSWVEFEIRRARKREVAEQRRLLFPVRLVDYEAIKRWECFDADTAKDLATEIREYYIPDFSQWKSHDAFEEAMAQLLRDLKAESTKPDASA